MHTFARARVARTPSYSLSFPSNRVSRFSFFFPSVREPHGRSAYAFLRRGKARCNECATHQDIARNISLLREETLPSVNFNSASPRTFILLKPSSSKLHVSHFSFLFYIYFLFPVIIADSLAFDTVLLILFFPLSHCSTFSQ